MKQKNVYEQIPESDVVVRYANTRFRKGLGTNIFVIGLPGTGKSSTCFRLCELIVNSNPQMDRKMFCVDSLLGLLHAIKQTKEGDCIIIEEVSVLFPSRRAMGKDNLSIGKIFDTIRKKRLFIISNAPLWNSIDSHMKALGDILIETLGINKTEKIVVSKFFRLQTNPASGKCYKHTMMRGNKETPLMFTRMPNLERWMNYEKQKDNFIDNLREKLEREQVTKRKKEEKEIVKPQVKDFTERELQIHKLYHVDKKKQKEIVEITGLSAPRVHNIVQNVIRKSQIPEVSYEFSDKIPLIAPLN